MRTVALVLLAAAVVGAQTAVPLVPNQAVTGSVGLASGVYYSIPVTEAVAHDGLVVEIQFSSGLLHLYSRCGAFPTLSRFDDSRLPQSLKDQEYEMYLPNIGSCVGKTMYFLAYGYHFTPSYKILAHFGGTRNVDPFEDTPGQVSRGNWQFFKLQVRNYAGLRIIVALTGTGIGSNGVYVSYKSKTLPSSSDYEQRVNVYKTASPRCIDLVVPTQGAAYIGVWGEVGENITYRLQIQPNLEPNTPCLF